MSGIVVAGVDGSEGALRALRWAGEEARLRGARLRAVSVWSYLDQTGEAFDPTYGEDDARRLLDEAVAAAGLGAGALDVERKTVCDLPPAACSAPPATPTSSSSGPAAWAASGASCWDPSASRWPSTHRAPS